VDIYLGLFSSEERIGVLMTESCSEHDEIFWPVFLQYWSMCDDTWLWRSILLEELKVRTSRAPAILYLDDGDRAFYDSLPDVIRVYRGCSRPRVRGLAWTTNREVAVGFALGHRRLWTPTL